MMEALLGLACLVAGLAVTVSAVRFLTRRSQPAAKLTTNPPARVAQRVTRCGISESRLTVTVSVGDGAERRHQPDDARWISADEQATVAGYAIPGGLLYVGSRLKPVAGWREVEPALVNPSLPIDDQNCDWTGAQMSYWPSYSEIAPGCRAAYLRWLADGRRHPTVGIGYVFLFFYGLERRLIADAACNALPAGEKESILIEVVQLLSVYGHHGSFAKYAGEFLALHRLPAGGRTISEGPPPIAPNSATEIPLNLRIGLGEFSSSGLPIPPEWALAWVRANPEIHLRTPALRCATEFETLFVLRYRKQFGQGMIVKPNRTRISAAYRPASGSFEGTVPFPIADLPDLTVLTGPTRTLQGIAESCTDDLDGYSRLVGRDPSAEGKLAGIALLPGELVAQHQGTEAARLSAWVDEAMSGGDAATVDGAALLSLWSPEPKDKLPKPDAVLLAQFLQRRGIGIEPDVRFGGAALSAETKAVLFRLPSESPATPSAQHHAASVLLHLAAAVAQADGNLDASEERHLIGHLQEAMHLEKAERLRLAAHLRWVLANPVGLGGLKKRLAQLDGPRRDAVARFLVAVVGADGRVEPTEVKTLAKIYSLLGLDAVRVYTDLHELGVSGGDPGPVTVRAAAPGQGGFEIPARPTPGPSALVLDPERLRAKMAETAAVGALLRGVFAEEDEPAPVTASAVAIAGLDAAHSEFLRALASKSSWLRRDLEATAAGLRLMLDGALEIINERAFDTCGQAACEGEDPVETNPEALKELLR
jgi:tellurite resistance protein